MADVSYIKVGTTTYSINDVDAEQKIAQKMALVNTATNNNVAIFDANGQVKDSGATFTPAGIGAIPNVGGATVNNIPVLQADGTLIDSGYGIDKKLTVGKEILSGDNLNDYDTELRAYCPTNAAASASTNFPVPKAGYLDVQTTANSVFQIYQTYDNSGRYSRYRYQGTWSSWVKDPVLVTGATNNNVALLDSNGQVKDSGKPLTPNGIGAVALGSGATSASATSAYNASNPLRVVLRVTNSPSGDYGIFATDTGIYLWNYSTNTSEWIFTSTDRVRKQNKTISGNSGAGGYISLSLSASYGVLSVRDVQATHICIPYWSTASNGWYVKVLSTSMTVATNADVELDVDYYAK